MLRSNSANPHLISRLLLGKLTRDNLAKLLTYTLDHLTRDYVGIVTMSTRLASYALTDKAPAKIPLDFANIQSLL